jgi:pyruvate/2-oxoglutarate dehydrogenase complex dihydrolipoamide dehydrogenase (E3) component
MAEHFEYAIIGGGKGGKTLAMDLAHAGRQVLMVERGLIGGSCINVACIPTKTMVRSATVAELARRGAEFGVSGTFQVDLAAVRRRKRAVVAGLVQANRARFDQSGMTFVLGSARFTGNRAFAVKQSDGGERSFTADKVFINTGTRPALPDLPSLAEAVPLTSESIMELDRLPEHLLVLGGGYIGLEFAQMFRRFGSKVTVVERGVDFLPREDRDIAAAVQQLLTEEGVEVLTGAQAVWVEGQSGQSVQLILKTTAGERTLAGSDLLVALGRIPNTGS